MKSSRRRGVTAVFVVVMMTVLLGFAALTVDLGMLYNVRGDMQRTADSAALASANALMNEDRLRGSSALYGVIADSRTTASEYAARNSVYGVVTPALVSGDVGIGYLRDPGSTTEALDTGDSTRFNAVSVRVRRDETCNSPVQLLFARVFGIEETPMFADATAAFMDGVTGFRHPGNGNNPGILPFALRVSSWQNLLSQAVTMGDNYAYDPQTETVSPGSDGILELNLYPGGGSGQLPPGNFGTVDIGSPGNSAADLARQIREGVSEDDLSFFGGTLELDSDGTLSLNGDTGLSAGVKDDLESIKGKPRTIPLFSTVAGPGNNSMFTVVGFAGIRIMNVKLTGSMSSKNVIIQPAFVLDDTVITGPATGLSYFIYEPVRLVR